MARKKAAPAPEQEEAVPAPRRRRVAAEAAPVAQPATAAPVRAPWEVVDDAPAQDSPAAPPVDPMQVLSDWYAMQQHIATTVKPLLEQEIALRRQVASLFFTNPEEGTNTVPVYDGWDLKYVYNVDRKIDPAQLEAVKPLLPPGTVDYVVDWQPKLKLSIYKSMPDHLRTVFDDAVISKPGSPVLSLVQRATKQG